MNKTIAEKWCTALRSGTYKQTEGVLCRRSEDGTTAYCCLGVLQGPVLGLEGAYTLLNDEATALSGMASCDGSRFGGLSLSSLNDQGATFAEIADIIEAEWEDL